MMRTNFAVMALTLLLPAAAAAQDGRAVFDKACSACHFERRDPARMKEMVAPPMEMMAAHVRDAVGNDRAAFLRQVTGFIKAPSVATSIEPAAVERFGLMPPIRDSFPELTDAELDAVAAWMFDHFAGVSLPTPEQRQKLLEQTR